MLIFGVPQVRAVKSGGGLVGVARLETADGGLKAITASLVRFLFVGCETGTAIGVFGATTGLISIAIGLVSLTTGARLPGMGLGTTATCSLSIATGFGSSCAL